MWIFYCVVGISNILENVKSIRNPLCFSRTPNTKTINNIADYNFYISMARLKANFPAPGHLTVNFFPAPEHSLEDDIFPAPRHLCTKILLTPGMPGDGMVRVGIERDITYMFFPLWKRHPGRSWLGWPSLPQKVLLLNFNCRN